MLISNAEESIDLIKQLDELLIELLQSLTEQEWKAPTIAKKWLVKDIAAHLLDGNIRTLSILRDQYAGDPPGKIESYNDLVKYLNRLNADWVQAFKRVSPNILIELLKSTGQSYADYLTTLDPMAPAVFSVAWAGESNSSNQFHIAREYTEKWHHQQQIRLAVGKTEPLYSETLYRPYLNTSLMALPHHFRRVHGNTNDALQISIVGNTQKNWYLTYKHSKWEISDTKVETPNSSIQIKDEIAWRIFTKGIDRQKAINESQITGNTSLAEHFFTLTAIMA